MRFLMPQWLRDFLSDVRRIREALERLSPPYSPPDPRRKTFWK